MNPTEIDDALRNDPRIEPSAAFRLRVLNAVHAHAAARRPQRLLKRVLWRAAAVTSVAAALPLTVMLLDRSDVPADATMDLVRWLSFTLTGTLALAWRTTRRVA